MAIGLVLSPIAHAAEGQFDWLSFSGFGTIGASETDDKAVSFRMPYQKNGKANDWATDVDSRIAAQFDVNRGGTFSGVLQVMATQRYQGEFRAEVEWANVMWTINENWRVRAGRMVTPVFLASDYKNVGYSIIPVRYSLEMSGNYPLSRHDGAEVLYNTEVWNGRLQVQGYAGKTKYDFINALGKNSLDVGGIYGVSGTYSTGPWTVRLAGSAVRDMKTVGDAVPTFNLASKVLHAIPPAACSNCAEEAQKLDTSVAGMSADFLTIGGIYDDDTWYGQLEFGHRKIDGFFPSVDSYLALGAYRWKRFTPFLSYAVFKTKSNDEAALPALPGIPGIVAAQYNGLLKANNSSRSMTSVGVRWDFYTNVALKLQADLVKHDRPSYGWSGAFTNLSPTTYDGKVNVYTATIDFIF
ncbi:hypothetical protein GCM10025771_11300 [Niveibacterium umoris]